MKIHVLGIVSLMLAVSCFAQQPPAMQPCAGDAEDCPSNEAAAEAEKVERITVFGQRFLPVSHDAQGYYVLDAQMISDYSFGNGNLNELLAILPGVQYAEDAYAATQVANIRPPEVSIAGTQGYQTGYLIDGVGNNSKLSTGNAQLDRNLIQNVSGHSQQTFINTKLLDQVQVFDSNIPARYGDFSGGLVLAETKNAGAQTEFGFSVRHTGDELVSYHRLLAPDFDGTMTLGEPSFSKSDVNAYWSMPLSENSGLVTQLQILRSKEAFDQLGRFRQQTQTNYNALLKYHQQITLQDKLEIRLLHAPFSGDYFDVNAIDSDYETSGGGSSVLFNWQASRSWANIESQLSWSQSENSKRAANIWYVWKNLPGRDWGSYNATVSSLQGGYGDIDKTQDDWRWQQDLQLDPLRWSDSTHNLNLGYQLSQQHTRFQRLEDAIIYNGSLIALNVDCGAYTLDCLETTLERPLEDIEAELGRALDLLNPEDFLLFQNNIVSTGQYFQSRQLSPKSDSEASINSLAIHAEDHIEYGNLDVIAGLRYDYNDYFKNHNLAPRLRAEYRLFDDYQFIFGANRYYDSDLINYKLNEAIQPFISEIRNIRNNRPGQWLSAVVPSGPRYVYTDTQTPYSDELTLAYRQSLFAGLLELRLIERSNKQSISRSKGFDSEGAPILFAENFGKSRYRRLSLVWAAQFGLHNIELNLSRVSNTVDAASFDGTTVRSVDNSNDETFNFTYDDSDLVFLRTSSFDEDNGLVKTNQKLITRHDLALERQDANRPFIANLSWSLNWQRWSFSAHARYMGEQDAIFATNETATFRDADSICTGCQPNRREYPVYRLDKRRDFTLVNASLQYRWPLLEKHSLTVSIEGQNVLNARTYQVGPVTSGIELGRQIWLGVSYDH